MDQERQNGQYNPTQTQPTVGQPVSPQSQPIPPIQPVQSPPSLSVNQPSNNKRRLLIAVGVAIAVVGAAIYINGGGPTSKRSYGWDVPALPKLTQTQLTELEQKYGYDVVYKPDTAPEETFTLDVNYEYSNCQATTCADALSLYSDAALTKRVTMRTTSLGAKKTVGQTVTVHPPATNRAMDSSKLNKEGYVDIPVSEPGESGVEIAGLDTWGIAETYFLVERLDADGKKLARPKVTLFTLRSDRRVLPATDVSTDVDSNGAVRFSWNPVKDAKKYYVVKITRDPKNGNEPRYELLAQTDKTSLNFAEYNGDKARAEAAESSKSKIATPNETGKDSSFNQNHQFSNFGMKTEDSYYANGGNGPQGGTYVPTENGLLPTTFAVIGVNGDRYSAVREMDGNALLAEIPLNTSHNQILRNSQQAPKETKPGNFEKFLLTVPVTMADGRTVKKPALYDAKRAVVDRSAQADFARIPYRVQGTYFVDSSYVYDAKNILTQDYLQKKIQEVNKRNLAAVPPTGSKSIAYTVKFNSEALRLNAPKQTSNNAKIDTTSSKQAPANLIPAAKYPVNGSTDLVKYVAANLMNGSYKMSISKYYNDPTVSIAEAFDEAVTQNPYLAVYAAFMRYSLRGDTLQVTVSGISEAEIIKRQNDLYARAKMVSGSIINGSMSERDKALAINRWLGENAAYDYDAFVLIQKVRSDGNYMDYYTSFPYAWNGLGVSVYKEGVCASYADAFKAIADISGLKSIVVTGTENVSGGMHAWNKVFMDGKWQVVDATWNDTPSGVSTTYFGLTDANANRVEGSSFMVNRFVSDFAAK